MPSELDLTSVSHIAVARVINQSIMGGIRRGGALPRLRYGATPGGHALRVSMQHAWS